MKNEIRLLFCSGQSSDELGLQNKGSFKAAEMRYAATEQININDLKRWLEKCKHIQWDYNTNVIYIIWQYFINLTVVNADGIKQIV